MEVRGRRAADDDRNAQPAAFQLRADVGHFVERRRNQAAQADALRTPCHRFVDDALRFDHDTQVIDFISVAGHHDRHDILADVVHVAFHGGDQHLSGVVCSAVRTLFDVGRQGRHGALHHAGGLHDLGQEHLAFAEQRSDPLHRRHQQGVDYGHRTAQRLVTLQRILLDVIRHAFEHRVADAFPERPRAPCVGGLRCCFGRLPYLLGIFREPLGGVGPAAKNHILDPFEQFGLDLAVYAD